MTTYEIRINGTVPSSLVELLGTVRIVQAGGITLEVDVPDDAALWGLVDALRGADIDLLELRPKDVELSK